MEPRPPTADGAFKQSSIHTKSGFIKSGRDGLPHTQTFPPSTVMVTCQKKDTLYIDLEVSVQARFSYDEMARWLSVFICMI